MLHLAFALAACRVDKSVWAPVWKLLKLAGNNVDQTTVSLTEIFRRLGLASLWLLFVVLFVWLGLKQTLNKNRVSPPPDFSTQESIVDRELNLNVIKIILKKHGYC